MATNTVKRQARRAVAAGAIGAATIGAFLLPATASAQPLTIPGVGTFEVPNEIPIPPGIPAVPGIAPGPGAPFAPPFVAPQKALGEVALDAALSKVGSPYVYGAAGPNAFDCSGLVQWAYRQAGRELPRTSGAQLASGAPVSLNDLRPGDVVSFYGGGHSGLYAGNGNVVHAASAGSPVHVAPISSMPFAGARRY
ncbi:C40 family peptidase [Nocardia higoensis]|uniref:C40 family peptidase n=1 Tax=Nocardia higoensis TaxID=228599 RepID=A0ABS0DFH5_9NOCA|nr:C40 family peptidase [Nocardia higoensis]MBF6357231.1 C40 family peptidase [Nocardia higoensis]